MREASIPRIRIPVYPTPFPASEVVTKEGVPSNKKGKSCPKAFFSKVFSSTKIAEEDAADALVEVT